MLYLTLQGIVVLGAIVLFCVIFKNYIEYIDTALIILVVVSFVGILVGLIVEVSILNIFDCSLTGALDDEMPLCTFNLPELLK